MKYSEEDVRNMKREYHLRLQEMLRQTDKEWSKKEKEFHKESDLREKQWQKEEEDMKKKLQELIQLNSHTM